MNELDRALHRAPQPPRRIDHIAHILRLDRMAMVVVAATEMDVMRHG